MTKNLNNYRQQQTDNGTHKDALNIKEGRKFIDLYKKESRRIGRAIVYILISVGLISTFDVFNLAELAVLLMFLVVALSVSMLIMAGMRIDGALEDGSEVFLTDEAYFTFQNEFKTFKEKEAYRIALGVALCILSVVPLLLFDFLNNENLVEVVGVLLLLALVGLGVYQFIRYGMTYSAYERILNVGEYTKENLEYERRIEPFAGIYWLLMVLIYLTWSFITMDWHITWIMWPIAGVLWAIIALLIRVFSNE